MENSEIINLWKSYNQQLEDSLTLHRQTAEEVSKLKVQSLISTMQPVKLFTLVVGTAWVLAGFALLSNLFVYAYADTSKFFLFSAGFQVLVTAIALVFYVYQLVLMGQVDISEPVLATQERLANLQVSTIWATRILLLQLPVWATFWWTETMFREWNLVQLSVVLSVAGLLAYAAVWLFFNIKVENRDKKWFKVIFDGQEWAPLVKSKELLAQVEGYKAG